MNIVQRARYVYRFVTTVLGMMLTAQFFYVTQVFLLPFPRLRGKYQTFCFRITTGTMLFFMGVKLKVTGKPPKTPFFLVANHLSYIDILALAKLTGCVFVSKKEVRKWPGIGWVAYVYGSMFLDRENKQDLSRVSDLIEKRMALGKSVVVFPEGTSSDGQQVLPFYSPLFKWAAEHEHEVCCASFSYDSKNPKMPSKDFMCWWGDMEFTPHFKNLTILKKPILHLNFASETVKSNNRKELAKMAFDLVSQNFEKSV